MVWLKAEAGVAIGMELQGQEDAGARVASGVCVGSVAKCSELLEWLEWPHEPSICVARGLLSAWPGAFYLRKDQGGRRGGKDGLARLEGLEDMKTEKLE